jgi:hypothetical protein
MNTKRFGMTFTTNDSLPLSEGPVEIKQLSCLSSGEARVVIRTKAGDMVKQVIDRLLNREPLIYALFEVPSNMMLEFNDIHVHREAEIAVEFKGRERFLQCWLEVYDE